MRHDCIFICKNCNTIFNKPFKIVINCCKKDSLIDDQIFHIAKIVKNLFMCKHFLTTNQPYLTAHIFLESNVNYHN